MDKNDIELGKHYAIREHPDDDLQHVKILEPVRSGKWRAEWTAPNPGLIDYVASRHIIVPWGQRRALLRDERNAATITAAVERSGYPGDRHPVASAVVTVLDTTGERAPLGEPLDHAATTLTPTAVLPTRHVCRNT